MAHRREGNAVSTDVAEHPPGTAPEVPTALGATLRFWRERTHADEQTGSTRRRRTPGLRRTELASLAGVSEVYVTQIEQGRARTPSEQVLRALASALRLSAIERDHLFRLAERPAPLDREPPEAAPEEARAALAAFHSLPAALYNVRWDIIAWNERWVTLLGDPLQRPPSERNLVWRHFAGLPSRLSRTEDEIRQFEREVTADLRQAAAGYPQDAELQMFVQALRQVSERFTALWDAHEVASYRGDHKLVHHPVVGTLELDCVIVDPRVDGLHIAVFSPRQGSADEASFRRLFAA
jgi:transcriptional regulator with XRE-family HTH domain